MNKLFRAANGNKRAAAVIILSVALIVGLWYFLHPSSSYHKKVNYVLRFTEIGTLSPGNRVQVNGLSKGKITDVNITDDYIFVTMHLHLFEVPLMMNRFSFERLCHKILLSLSDGSARISHWFEDGELLF